MKFVVCSGRDNGHFVIVEVTTPEEAADAGVEVLMAEWPDSYVCQQSCG